MGVAVAIGIEGEGGIDGVFGLAVELVVGLAVGRESAVEGGVEIGVEGEGEVEMGVETEIEGAFGFAVEVEAGRETEIDRGGEAGVETEVEGAFVFGSSVAVAIGFLLLLRRGPRWFRVPSAGRSVAGAAPVPRLGPAIYRGT